jgi:hypothetical protein
MVAMFTVDDKDLVGFKGRHPNATRKFPDDLPTTVTTAFAETGTYINKTLKDTYIEKGWKSAFIDVIETMVKPMPRDVDEPLGSNYNEKDYSFLNGTGVARYIASGVSGSVFAIAIAFRGEVFEFAVKVQDATDTQSKVELKYMKHASRLAEGGNVHTAWLIDSFVIKTEAYPLSQVIVMMKAQGTLYDLLRSGITTPQRRSIVKHALVSTLTFHTDVLGTHGDSHGDNYFYFDIPTGPTVVKGLNIPACEYQVVLYDPGMAHSVSDMEPTVYDTRYGRYARHREDDGYVETEPHQRMNLDYRQVLSACLGGMNGNEWLYRRIESAIDILLKRDFDDSLGYIQTIFSIIDGQRIVTEPKPEYDPEEPGPGPVPEYDPKDESIHHFPEYDPEDESMIDDLPYGTYTF